MNVNSSYVGNELVHEERTEADLVAQAEEDRLAEESVFRCECGNWKRAEASSCDACLTDWDYEMSEAV